MPVIWAVTEEELGSYPNLGSLERECFTRSSTLMMSTIHLWVSLVKRQHLTFCLEAKKEHVRNQEVWSIWSLV